MNQVVKELNLNINHWHKLTRTLDTVETFYDVERRILLVLIKNEQTLFNLKLVKDIKDIQSFVFEYFQKNPYASPRYILWSSNNRNIFSLGLDLEFILECKKYSKVEQAGSYLQQCLDACYIHLYSMSLPIVNISYIQGNAWGAGLAFALLSDIVFCDENTKFGFNDIKTNIFPSFNSFFILSRIKDIFSVDELLNDGLGKNIEKLLKNNIIDVILPNNSIAKITTVIEKIDPVFYAYLSAIKVAKKAHFVDQESVNGFLKLWIYSINGMNEEHVKIATKLIENQYQLNMS